MLVSPAFFLMVVEGLGRDILEEKQKGNIDGIQYEYEICLTHIIC